MAPIWYIPLKTGPVTRKTLPFHCILIYMPHLGDGISWLYICSFLARSYPTPSLHVIVITSVKNPDILATSSLTLFGMFFPRNMRNIIIFSIVSRNWESSWCWNVCSWETWSCLSCNRRVLLSWRRKEPNITIRDVDPVFYRTWWRHQMETFSALLAFCAGYSAVPGEFPAQRPVTRSCEVFFDLRPNKPLSKQSWGWWSGTPSSSLWRHRNEIFQFKHGVGYDNGAWKSVPEFCTFSYAFSLKESC